ncbi:glutamate-1-semialdehyde 2,1-aminomutase [Aquifex aeolicus]|uniref:Glutamate-1-semialdehyde 2,1-aminomutase n=1 Tax=Aquifex aeolicus (strain VF5) TaxID=224324 RepID=GSA_AQUAE|nr:glutamate-1-semialdehyde 2,1-aminomutase [Aquifex aeolicus]O66998.1 RecName: Full=Glutamate-1-semialdehyde 2,1-aminomutase; Short=GSA; AltName: Full=Glutamate-1-semialdehyde aminotransferase; Short=GSA-AT [Aquifex aeolicus VF5]AAC06964.1 glutamate-1-semialdehyde aminotransferase [Aquifex aeolicus VF5]
MKNEKLYREALQVMPGGVNSPVRAFKAVGGKPIFLVKGRGPRVWDAEGNEYIDFLASWGAIILGHAPKKVVKAVQEEAEKGLSFGLTNPHEVTLAKLVVEMVPSVEKVRFVNSGTEATMSAVRLARGVTGRKYIVKFEGCYHGHYDSLLVSAGSGVATFGIPGTPGIPEEIAKLTIVLPYNDVQALEEAFKEYGSEIAGVIVEPIAGNMGVVPPKKEFLIRLRELTKEYGSLLMFDEVITGFRLSKGGAQELFGIEPDITCLGKILGGGLPVGAYGGRREIMERVAPEGEVYQAGTLAGNPLAMVSGSETLKDLRDKEPYKELEEKMEKLARGVKDILTEKGIQHTINKVGSMMTVFFTDKKVVDFQTAKTSDTELFAKFFRALLNKGVLIPPSQFEAWFLTTAHEEEVIDEALERIRDAVKEL